jgi:undecaprenyl-diphosphatase
MTPVRKFLQKVSNFEEPITFDFDTTIKDKKLKKAIFIITESGSTIGSILIYIIISLFSGIQVLYTFVPIYLFQLGSVEIIKTVFKRPRPKTHRSENLFGFSLTSGSFPSGHTSNLFTSAFLITNFYGLSVLGAFIIFSIASLLAGTRLILGKHYIGDILAGAVTGLTLALTGALIYKWAIYKIILLGWI